MPVAELFRHDLTLLKAASGSDTRQVPAGSATVDLYWKGATVRAGSSGIAGHVIAVYDPGTFAVGDQVKKGGVGTSGTVGAVAATTVTVTWGSSVTVAVGDRLVLTLRASGATRPVAYSDSQGTVSLGSQVTTSSVGGTSFYTFPREIDFVATVDGQTQVLPDQTGQGAQYDLWDFGLVADGTTNDYPALLRFINYITLKGKTEVRLPAGTIQVNTSVVITTPLKVVGSGRDATKLQGTAGIWVLDLQASNCIIEDLTITRSGTGSAGSRLLNITGVTGTTLNTLNLDKGAIGVYDAGVNTTANDLTFSGLGWESYWYGVGSSNSTVHSLRGFGSNAIASANGGIRLDGTLGARFESCDISAGPNSGPQCRIEKTGLLTPSATFVACVFNPNTTADPAVVVTAGVQLRFIGCDLYDGSVGYHINGANVNDVQIIGGSVVGMDKNSVDVDAGNNVHIVELLSSDCNSGGYADNRADHINVAAGVDNFSVNGLTVGKIVNGGGADARDGVRVEAGVSDNVQITGVRGIAADLTGDFVNCYSTSQSVDIGHNFTRTGRTAYHTGVPGGYVANGQAGTKALVGAETTTSVANVSSIILIQSGNTVWTNLTDGREGQVITIMNNSGSNTATFSSGANFKTLGAASRVLGQYDTLTLIYNGSVWVEVAFAANS